MNEAKKAEATTKGKTPPQNSGDFPWGAVAGGVGLGLLGLFSGGGLTGGGLLWGAVLAAAGALGGAYAQDYAQKNNISLPWSAQPKGPRVSIMSQERGDVVPVLDAHKKPVPGKNKGQHLVINVKGEKDGVVSLEGFVHAEKPDMLVVHRMLEISQTGQLGGRYEHEQPYYLKLKNGRVDVEDSQTQQVLQEIMRDYKDPKAGAKPVEAPKPKADARGLGGRHGVDARDRLPVHEPEDDKPVAPPAGGPRKMRPAGELGGDGVSRPA